MGGYMKKNRYFSGLTALIVLFFLSTVHSAPITLTLNPSIEHQTIEGLGGQGIDALKIKDGAFWKEDADSTCNLLVNDIGISMVRVFLQGEWSLSNTGPMEDFIDDIKGLEKYDKNIKYIVTVLSPPAHMKTNGKVEEGGKLKVDMYDEFVQWCVEFLDWVKEETGVEVYALGPQNELLFKEPYGSCIYTTSEFRDVVKKLGPKLKEAGYKTKIFGPEHMTHMTGTLLSYPRAIYNDEESRPYFHAIASHGYGGDGTTANAGGPRAWASIYNYAKDHDMQVWMTETSNYSSEWEFGYHAQWNSGELKRRDGGFKLAQALYGAMKFGNLSGWTYLGVSTSKVCQDSGDNGPIVCNNGLSAVGYAMKHYYRFIRPGAIRIETSSPDEDVLVLAFRHKEQEKTTIVLINGKHIPVSVELQGAGFPQKFEMYESDKDLGCEHTKDINSGNPIELRPRSVVTLYGDAMTVGVGKYNNIHLQNRESTNRYSSALLYSLDGKCVAKINSIDITTPINNAILGKKLSKGIYYIAFYNKSNVLVKTLSRVQIQ